MARAPRKPSSTSNEEKVEHQGPAPDPTETLRKAMEIFSEGPHGMPDWKELKLPGKIAAISGFLGRIPKNGFNKYNSYWYVLESDLVEAIRYYLAAARILVYPEEIRHHQVFTFEGQANERGRQRDILTDNIYVYRVVDGYTGETFTFEANGQGSDPRDKGSNKASTGAMKFAYLRLFNISSGEDEPEADIQGDQAAAEQTGNGQPVTVTPNHVEGAQRGGRQEKATSTQIKAISNLSNQLNLGALGLVGVIERVLGAKVELPDEEAKQGPVLASFLQGQDGESVGKLIYALNEMVRAASEPDTSPLGY